METNRHFMPNLVRLATAYAAKNGEGKKADSQENEFVIPESFDALDYAAVQALHEQAIATFDEQFDAKAPVSVLAPLTEGIEALSAELTSRDLATKEEEDARAEFATRVDSFRAKADDGEESEAVASEIDEEEEDKEPGGVAEPGNLPGEEGGADDGKLSRKEIRVSLSSVKRKTPKVPAVTPAPPEKKRDIRDVLISAGEGTGFALGQGMTFEDAGKAINHKLIGANAARFSSAASMGRQISESHTIAHIRREFPEDLTISDSGLEHVDAVLNAAVDQSRLPGGSLVASGGWCAPSEVSYDLLEIETDAGMASLPEVNLRRGGLKFTKGPDFGQLFAQFPGFFFTEQDDIDGAYAPGPDGNVEGPKPCARIDCVDFEEVRLDVAGLCIQAGLLQSRGYPELIARTLRGAVLAHRHRMNGRMIRSMAAQSTPVIGNTAISGTAGVLDLIELQVAHYRATHRLELNQTLEAIFPFWTRGVIRADLALREGVDLIHVPDARIDAWFRERGLVVQYVYNWQEIDTVDASDFSAWPTKISFMLYLAGTFVRGTQPIITLGTLFDSTLLSQNDFSALFTEEGDAVIKRGHDSRLITMDFCPSGQTAAAVLTDCSGLAA